MFRGLLTGGAALAALAAIIVGPASAAPAPVAGTGNSGSGVVGAIAGVVPPLGSRPAAAAARSLASCTEPDCNVSYQGGLTQHKPRVYLVFWGPNWTRNATEQAVAGYLRALYKGLGGKQDTWSLTAAQYGDSTGHATFGTSVLAGSYVDTSAPPKSVSLTRLGTEALNAAKHFKIKNTFNAQVVIAAQSHTCFAPDWGQVFAGNCGKTPSSPPANGYCGWHSAVYANGNYLTFTNLPYELDAGQFCGKNWLNAGARGTLDGFSLVGGHEYTESVSDPVPSDGWIDPRDSTSGGEIADKCAWAGAEWGDNDAQGDVRLSTGSFAMQSVWSNVTHSCVMSGLLPLTVTPLGNQAGLTGAAVSLRVAAGTTPTAPLTFKAAGLPGGLSIGRASGRITGKPDVTAGTFNAKVTVAYYAGSYAFRFTWLVSSPPGPVKGYDAKCADSSGGRSGNGNKIDLWSCTGKAAQQITFTSSGELSLLGSCVTGGATAFLEPCKGTANQVWTRLANRSYVLKLNGKCLTDPRSSKRNGTVLTLAACKNTANQHWSLP